MTDHLKAAIGAAAEEVHPSPLFDNESDYEAAAESIINAALPHLEKHFAQDPNVRRAIIQELANEAEAEFEHDENLTTRTIAGIAESWLHAKLKKAEQ